MRAPGAASVILTRSSAESSLRDWGLKLREWIGFRRVAAVVTRKLAGVMHAMLKCGELFDRLTGTPAKHTSASDCLAVLSPAGT